jgi:hypothetical protein
VKRLQMFHPLSYDISVSRVKVWQAYWQTGVEISDRGGRTIARCHQSRNQLVSTRPIGRFIQPLKSSLRVNTGRKFGCKCNLLNIKQI